MVGDAVIDDLGPACHRVEARLADGHHVLGELLVADADELPDVVARFLKICRELVRRVHWFETLLRDDAHPAGWLDPLLAQLAAHPLTRWLRLPASPAEAEERLARGTTPPYAIEPPSVAVCASFLDLIAEVLAHAKREAAI